MPRGRPSLVRRLSPFARRLFPFVRRLPSLARLAVALALLTSPFWLFPHAGETAYQYETERIEYTEGVAGYLRAPETLDRLPCYAVHERRGLCTFAAHIAQHGPVTVNVSETLGRRYDAPSEYVVVEDSGDGRPFYRWNVTGRDDGDADRSARRTYSLAAVGPETILRDLAVNGTDASPRVRRMLDGETVTVYAEPPAGESLDHDEVLDAHGEVVRSNGSYYLVTRAGRQRPDRSDGEARTVRGVLVAVGLALLWRGRYGPRRE